MRYLYKITRIVACAGHGTEREAVHIFLGYVLGFVDLGLHTTNTNTKKTQRRHKETNRSERSHKDAQLRQIHHSWQVKGPRKR